MEQPRPQVLLANIAFSERIRNVFRNNNLVYLDDVAAKTEAELRGMRSKVNGSRGLGRECISEIVVTLDMYGRTLRREDQDVSR